MSSLQHIFLVGIWSRTRLLHPLAGCSRSNLNRQNHAKCSSSRQMMTALLEDFRICHRRKEQSWSLRSTYFLPRAANILYQWHYIWKTWKTRSALNTCNSFVGVRGPSVVRQSGPLKSWRITREWRRWKVIINHEASICRVDNADTTRVIFVLRVYYTEQTRWQVPRKIQPLESQGSKANKLFKWYDDFVEMPQTAKADHEKRSTISAP